MANQRDAFFAALTDPTRRALIERLVTGPASVSDLHDGHDMALPSLLKHLTKLEKAGSVLSEKQGPVRTFALRPDPLALAAGWLAKQRKLWEARTDRLSQLTERLERPADRTRAPGLRP